MTLQDEAEKARAQGKSRFIGSKSCKLGHTERYSSNASCVICTQILQRRVQKILYEQNKECIREKNKKSQANYRKTHPDRCREAVNRWRQNNRARVKEHLRKYRERLKKERESELKNG